MPVSISKAQKLNEAKMYIIKVNRMVAFIQAEFTDTINQTLFVRSDSFVLEEKFLIYE